MKNYPFKSIAFLSIMICVFSCSDDEISHRPLIENEDKEIGRFDNSPFVWDEEHTLRSESQIFIGDISAERLMNNTTKNGRDGYNSNNIEITNPNGIYVGVAYDASSFGTTFDNEITEPRNPIDIVFDFKDPYIDEVQKETGSIGYKLALKRAIKSEEYKSSLRASKPSVEYSMTSYSSYSDIEKSIAGSAQYGAVFSAKVKASASSRNIKIQGRLLARMTGINFNVYMDTPIKSKGFFKEMALNNSIRGWNPVYMRSLTYGKAVYMSIESSYSYENIKKAFQASFSIGFASAKIKANEEITRILNSSVVTIFVIDDNSQGYSFYNFDKIGEINNLLFSNKFDDVSYGFPIFCEGRYVLDNKVFKPSIKSGSGIRPVRPSRPNTRPDYSPSRPSVRPSKEQPSRPSRDSDNKRPSEKSTVH